jgi:hypothetical protein
LLNKFLHFTKQADRFENFLCEADLVVSQACGFITNSFCETDAAWSCFFGAFKAGAVT